MRNNTGLIRRLKKIEKKVDSKPPVPKNNNDSTFISLIALIVSALAFYFQFFFEKHDLKASLVNSDITQDTINLGLVYQNKGNQDATVIKAEMFFFTDKNEKNKEKYLYFINKENDKTPPFILSSGKQVYHKFIQKVYFENEFNNSYVDFKKKDTIRVNLLISYINGGSLQSQEIIKCGWITLDSLKKIDFYSIDFKNIDLNSTTYISTRYNTKKLDE